MAIPQEVRDAIRKAEASLRVVWNTREWNGSIPKIRRYLKKEAPPNVRSCPPIIMSDELAKYFYGKL